MADEHWFINECGDPYPSTLTVEEQTEEFPDDDHTIYATKAEAEAACIAADARREAEGHMPQLDPDYVRTTQVAVPLEGVLDVMMRAATAAELSVNYGNDDEAEYADGAFDMLQFMFGLGGPSEKLKQVLRSGRAEDDDVPEDEPLGYPVVQRAF